MSTVIWVDAVMLAVPLELPSMNPNHPPFITCVTTIFYRGRQSVDRQLLMASPREHCAFIFICWTTFFSDH